MPTYQDVIVAEAPAGAWALTESSGLAFVPYIGGVSLAGSGTFSYRTTSPTDPFGFALHLNVGAKVSLAFTATVAAPDTWECWYKFSLPLSADQYLFYNGHAGVNGNGFYIRHTDNHVIYIQGASVQTDTGVIWPDSNWHLIQAGAPSTSQVYLAFDGAIRYQQPSGNPAAPSPNTLYIGGESGTSAAVAFDISWPAFYAYALSPGEIAADYAAQSDPSGAIGATVTGGLGAGSSSDVLARILAAVQRTFPTT